MQPIYGNTDGLKPSDLHRLSRIYRRRVPSEQVVTAELCHFLAETSGEIRRQVGVLIDRGGQVSKVIVGDATRLMLPDLGRLRSGRQRFRGLRLVHTHLDGEPLTRDDLTDLALLRLDLVAAVTLRSGDGPTEAALVHLAHLLPENAGGDLWRVLEAVPAHAITSVDFDALIRSLEEEFNRHLARASRAALGRERAVLVYVDVPRPRHGGLPDRHVDEALAELRELCRTADVEVLDAIVQRRPQPDPKYVIGKGKLEDINLRALQRGADLLIFYQDLSPAQVRAVADATELKVIDRTMLILDIFARRAQSSDGKLQVELAQLHYLLPRLVEKDTAMSRLTGGIGGRGPGETKLEINRRRVRERINRLENHVNELAKRRQTRRARRNDRGVPIVAIVGYTNAGKSTLLNSLTRGSVLCEDKLFATLDPTSRRLRFPREREVVITDTVGFIRDLPKDLIAAFRATLEELEDADLLLHLVDFSEDTHEQRVSTVDRTLEDLGLGNIPRLLVFNKSDRLPPEVAEQRRRAHGAIAISAQDVATTGPLLAAIEERLWAQGHDHAFAPSRAGTRVS